MISDFDIINYLEQHPESTAREITTSLNGGTFSRKVLHFIHRHLISMEKYKIVTKYGRGTNEHPYVWSVRL